MYDDNDIYCEEDEWGIETTEWNDPCLFECGPWCPSWLGDGLCQDELDSQQQEFEEFKKNMLVQ